MNVQFLEDRELCGRHRWRHEKGSRTFFGISTSRLPGLDDLPARLVGYGLGDMGFNFYWTNISTFLLILILLGSYLGMDFDTLYEYKVVPLFLKVLF